jgi:integrase
VSSRFGFDKLNDQDIDFGDKTIRIKGGKAGHEAIVPLNPEVIPVLMDYLKVRPSLKVNGEQPVFITDFCASVVSFWGLPNV